MNDQFVPSPRGDAPVPTRRPGLAWLVSWACLVGIAIGCSSRQPAGTGSGGPAAGVKRFVFMTNGDDPFWDACNAGLVEGAKRSGLESKGLRAVMEKGNGTAQGQIEKLRQLAAQGDVAGVAISVIQAENAAIVDEMKRQDSTLDVRAVNADKLHIVKNLSCYANGKKDCANPEAGPY